MVKGLKDENAPKRPLTAYFAWTATVRAKVTKSMPDGHSLGDIASKMGEMWKAMSDGQKAPFEKKYKSGMETYNKKLAKYKTTKEYAAFQKKKEQHKVDVVKKSKFKKDENAPARPLSSYFLFVADKRDALVEKGMAYKDAVAKCGEMWSALSAGKKKPYEDKAAAAKAKYEKAVEKYQKTASYKKYQKEKDEFMVNKKAELKKLDEKQNGKKPKKPSKSKSRSKSAKRSARKKVQKRSRSRSKSKKRAGKKKSRS